MPLSYGSLEDGGMQVQQAKYSLEKGGILFEMKPISRKVLMAGAMLDYDDAGANRKHDPPSRKPGGKP
ncbi:hypothetical protein COLO4_16797 [Corchorus olitorius]|uniref:Uncharacterized protein n=1 Tax=Corchorus olitorius TaxID=93759 RepID=A0A1R3JFJ9_9ROSI|nr:hypothetical protein COLO4_16797 [Corchorus olitorius]